MPKITGPYMQQNMMSQISYSRVFSNEAGTQIPSRS